MYNKFTKSTVTYKALFGDDSVTLFTCSCSVVGQFWQKGYSFSCYISNVKFNILNNSVSLN